MCVTHQRRGITRELVVERPPWLRCHVARCATWTTGGQSASSSAGRERSAHAKQLALTLNERGAGRRGQPCWQIDARGRARISFEDTRRMHREQGGPRLRRCDRSSQFTHSCTNGALTRKKLIRLVLSGSEANRSTDREPTRVAQLRRIGAKCGSRAEEAAPYVLVLTPSRLNRFV